MHAILLLSATLHIATIGLLAAFAWRRWLDNRRPKEPSHAEVITLAGAFACAVAVLVLVVTWFARPFGTALLTGLAGGLIAGLAFLLAAAAIPATPGHGLGLSRPLRRSAATFLGVVAAVELLAFCFLAAAAGSMHA